MNGSMYADLAHIVTFRPLERPVACQNHSVPFRASWSSTVALLAKELRAHGAKQAVLEVDLRESDFRVDGLPRADRRARTPGIVLSFIATYVPGRPSLRYEVGRYADWQANIRAVALGLESLRGVDRHGVTKRGEQYAGWKQLPTGSVSVSVEKGRQLVEKHGSVIAARKATHPDTSGYASEDDFKSVQMYADSLR